MKKLKRKALRNKVKAKIRQEKLKRLLFTPVIKAVDQEEIKKTFAANFG